MQAARILMSLLAAVLVVGPPALADPETGSRLATLLGSDDDAGFAKAIEPRRFQFPADHGPHPEYRNEWWYVTGNLDDENGRRFGFELTIFRFGLTPSAPEPDSRWRSNQVFIAHLALTDAAREQFLVAERYSRGAMGLAGARAEPFRVWIDDWQIAAAPSGDGWRLQASEDDLALDLRLVPQRPPVLNGVDGLSQKSAETGNASYYYSITRMKTEGALRVGGDEFEVSGLSWLDREWSSSALAADQQGWDWFALQLSDGSDLMFYSIRRKDGSQDPHSAGTLVGSDGSVTYVDSDSLTIDVTGSWQSPDGSTYPARWRLSLPDRGLNLLIEPVMDDQELYTTVRYWEGAVDVKGDRDGQPIEGRGYVELTGYAE